jgi:hypothetical protein
MKGRNYINQTKTGKKKENMNGTFKTPEKIKPINHGNKNRRGKS